MARGFCLFIIGIVICEQHKNANARKKYLVKVGLSFPVVLFFQKPLKSAEPRSVSAHSPVLIKTQHGCCNS